MKKSKEITSEWFNTAPDSEIRKFVLGMNDGQDDHSFYSFDEIVEILRDCDREGPDLYEMSRTEILDEFYEGLGLNANNSDFIYFNGDGYQYVNWVKN